MKLQQLRAFLATLDSSSFSEATLELDTSQSTVSYAVAELERPIYVAILPGSLKIPAVRAFLNVLKMQFPASELPRLELAASDRHLQSA